LITILTSTIMQILEEVGMECLTVDSLGQYRTDANRGVIFVAHHAVMCLQFVPSSTRMFSDT
jgi:hypothetical protein